MNPETISFSSDKLTKLSKANEKLNLNKSTNNKIVFIYSAPKVGSTSIVSSLRIFGCDKLSIIHIHDEEMLNVLAHIQDITINELILFNKQLGRDVYVINVYRSPIERKISAFFEKIGAYHFNNEDHKVNNYNITKVINRFNDIFPHIGLGDHFFDKYAITRPEQFDFVNKFLLVKEHNITYICLRLKDSHLWGNILSRIFGFKICIVKDYESSNKPIKDLYNIFKKQYKIPENLLNDVMNCKYLNYYFSSNEKSDYYNDWKKKSSAFRTSYNVEQYKLYEEITISNCHFDHVQLDHYMDEGCTCKACNIKRKEIAEKLIRGLNVCEKIIHTEVKNQFLENRIKNVNRINHAIHNHAINNISKKVGGKDFKQEMSNVLNGKK